MRLQDNSRLVKWAYLFNSATPRRTSLCAFFWRCVLWTPLGCAAILAAMGLIAAFAWTHMNLVKAVAVGSAAALVSLYAVKRAASNGLIDSLDVSIQRGADRIAATSVARNITVLWRGAKAIKDRMCPLIELVDDDEIDYWDLHHRQVARTGTRSGGLADG